MYRCAAGVRNVGMVWVWLAVSAAVVVGLSRAQADEDFGDFRSATLTSKAWEALGAGKLKSALSFTDKCRELYMEEARNQQGSVNEFASDEDAPKLWALNDVGTCLFIEGQVYEQQKKSKEAVAAYEQLVAQLGYAQCWDPQGWFWKPAEAAAKRIKELEFDAKLD
ncbi:MAG: beta-glucanase precursor [Pirellulales bacterium]|jgi:hypothetical protein|nr:beta-glucanase precursor [Pirellulales bacterium]